MARGNGAAAPKLDSGAALLEKLAHEQRALRGMDRALGRLIVLVEAPADSSSARQRNDARMMLRIAFKEWMHTIIAEPER